ncbi:unnamed protein product [Didymodactylos carnosus]|uniref:Integrase catalytic domain-containing protein n=1 Tax=Didymodactylos carnosus TaxID=1234261 RepID=A0A815Y0E6_9BILA|nr:unnamed protein product [Didymodactylos carnosus]CAF4425998.1 unnamed protein product [Didymodactylos carnosus]
MTHQNIIAALSLEKGKSSKSFSPAFAFWARKNFEKKEISGVDVLYCISSKKPVCIYESFYHVIQECHKSISHGGRDKTIAEVAAHYSWISRNVIEIYLKHCSVCQLRKPIKHPVVSKPIISLGVMTRLQIDLIDMRTRPDVISIDVSYLWILNCIGHFSKFSWSYPLQSKSAVEVAQKLRALFFVFGPPRLLHSDNGAEFVANVIVELKVLFPDMCFVRGRPRHPQSQGCVERANGVLTVALGKWLVDNNSSHRSGGLLPVVYRINTRVAAATKCTPYEVMFGQRPRSNSDFWKIVQDQDIQDEVQLPTPVEENEDLQDEVDVTNQLNSSLIDLSFNIIDNPSSDDLLSNNLMSFNSPTTASFPPRLPSSPIFDLNDSLIPPDSPVETNPKTSAEMLFHDLDVFIDPLSSVVVQPNVIPELKSKPSIPFPSIRNTSQSSIPVADLLAILSTSPIPSTSGVPSSTNNVFNISSPRHTLVPEQFKLRDCVGIPIHSVDRTNTDAKLLPCLIIAKEKKGDDVGFRLACQFGEMQNWYTVESLVDLRSSCPS